MKAAGFVAVVFLVASCEGRPGDPIVEPAPGPTLSVTPDTATLTPGETRQLRAVTAKLTSNAVTWQSGNQTVVTVSNTGLVTAAAVGLAVVVAISVEDPRARDAATIRVLPPPNP